MKCYICNKEETDLYEVIHEKKIVSVCRSCIEIENLTLIRKPTQDQLERANQRATVHERMMKMAGLDKLNPVSRDHEIAQRHLAKIKIPEKKQFSELLVSNYDWIIMMTRRRKKITLNQVSDLTKIQINDLENLEKGVLPKNFEKIARILESVLNIVILKETEKKMRFESLPEKRKDESEILEETRAKLFGKDLEINQRSEAMKQEQLEQELRDAERIAETKEEIKIEEAKSEFRSEIKEGRFDFSNRNKLKDVTLSDLVDMKREREKLAKKEKEFEESRKKEEFEE
jgi:protein-tyrosine-phosphatase